MKILKATTQIILIITLSFILFNLIYFSNPINAREWNNKFWNNECDKLDKQIQVNKSKKDLIDSIRLEKEWERLNKR